MVEEKHMESQDKDISIKWQQELDLFSSFKSLFILDGNINDNQLYLKEGRTTLSNLDEYLYFRLHEIGYHSVVFYDEFNGFVSRTKAGKTDLKLFTQILLEKNDDVNVSNTSFDIREASAVLPKAISQTGHPVALVFNLETIYIADKTKLSDAIQHFFTQVFQSSRINQTSGARKNLIILIANRISDIPSWVYSRNPYSRVMTLPLPDQHTRALYLRSQIRNFLPTLKPNENIEALADGFINATDGLTLIDIDNMTKMMLQKKWRLTDVRESVSLYKYGVKENPWTSKELLNRLPHLESDLKKRIKGQDICIRQASDIMTRSILGFSGIQHSNVDRKPKGVLFLAGPTGVGKTELAKSLAEWLFGSDDSCIRFDMSEYQLKQSDQRLLGAPPGYVGYDEGGQLTNAVKEHPFSVLLFDEIEKANVSVLDKFLQILEDGRMTDGRGETVYFNDCLIVFTSNLGVYQKNTMTGVSELKVPMPKTEEEIKSFDYETYRKQIMNVISDFFINTIGRPELLNRIGENFLIFNYITKEAASEILENQLKKIQEIILQTHHFELVIEDKVKEKILDSIAEHLENGGRGVGNSIEKNLLNPLSRVLAPLMFSSKQKEIHRLILKDIAIKDEGTALRTKVE